MNGQRISFKSVKEKLGLKNDFIFICPSYKRPIIASKSLAVPLSKYDNFFIAVNTKEGYDKFFPEDRMILVPEEIEGNLSRKRNWLLEREREFDETVVMFDDDVKALFWSTRGKEWLTDEEIFSYVDFMIEFANFVGAGLFGTGNSNKRYWLNAAYVAPFSFSGMANSEFIGIVDKSLRYDENIFIREDIDLNVQNLVKNEIVVLSNLIVGLQVEQHGFGAGGDRLNSKKAKIKHDIDYMIDKWKGTGEGEKLLYRYLKQNKYGGMI